MYAYPVHSSVPAPRTAARASWKSAVSGCLARGLKAHPIAYGHSSKRGHHRSDGPFWGSMSVFIRRLAAPACFPLPHAATGLPVRLPPYKVWERPLPRSRSCGVSPIHISSQNDFFPLHSICMEKSAYHSPCRCGMGCAGRHSPCLRQITKRGGLWIHKTKKLYLHGYSKQTL